MQDSRMKHPPLFVLVPVPYEAIVDSEIDLDEPLQFTVENGKITMEELEDDEINFVCDGHCGSCPMIFLATNEDCRKDIYHDDCRKREVL